MRTLTLNRPLASLPSAEWRLRGQLGRPDITELLYQEARRNRNQTRQLSGGLRTPSGVPFAWIGANCPK